MERDLVFYPLIIMPIKTDYNGSHQKKNMIQYVYTTISHKRTVHRLT